MRPFSISFSFLLALGFLKISAFELVTPNPTCEVQGLADYLESVYGNKILSGQMDDSYLDRIRNVSGKDPAMVAYDLDGVTPSQGYRNQDAEKAIAWVNQRGGVAQFSWHWIRPDAQGDYYSLGFDLPGALANTQSANYQAIIRDIDLAATELLKLKAAGVPVLWRPLHEAEGGWFWWGAHGREPLRQLYRLMYDRMVNHHGLNNLIWVWTSYVGDPNRQNWYPGDDVVDHIVYDYPDGNSWNAFNNTFGNSGKLFGIGENGRLPDPANFGNASWLYFLTWAYMINPEGVDRGQNNDDWINYVFNHDVVITLDELPDYKACTPPPPKQPGDNQAYRQLVTASSSDENINSPTKAVDGESNTRWSSAYEDNQWITVELEYPQDIDRVVLNWEEAYASVYEVQVSLDKSNWTTVHRAEQGQGGREEIALTPVTAAYVRILGVERATAWGISLYEFEVYRYLGAPVVLDIKHKIYPGNAPGEVRLLDAAGRMKSLQKNYPLFTNPSSGK